MTFPTKAIDILRPHDKLVNIINALQSAQFCVYIMSPEVIVLKYAWSRLTRVQVIIRYARLQEEFSTFFNKWVNEKIFMIIFKSVIRSIGDASKSQSKVNPPAKEDDTTPMLFAPEPSPATPISAKLFNIPFRPAFPGSRTTRLKSIEDARNSSIENDDPDVQLTPRSRKLTCA